MAGGIKSWFHWSFGVVVNEICRQHCEGVVHTSMAMLLTMVLSVFLFTFKPTLQLLLGIIICIMSLHMYFAPPSTLVDLPLAVKAAPQSGIEVSVNRITDS
ncbi:hypothetical protein L6452_33268 [Arctium lappa]|uniref:Uncharacterized protein n=1 Tax=Arctium lappa TaxID=4217 RepID=A0ACB8Z746_ARCLA|nr:hypothetical protein L6452_33268 [Arctium lappa]